MSGHPATLDRQAAQNCLTANLAMPGSGSVMGKRVVGYFQASLCIAGLFLTFAFGIRFIAWFFANRSSFNDPYDPLAGLREAWIHVRWALLGMVLFAVAWLWALMTSLSLMRRAKATDPAGQKNVSPRVTTSPPGM